MGGIPDWDFYTDTPVGTDWTLEISTPIVGSGSLLIQQDNNQVGLGTVNTMPTVASGYPTGKTLGRLRTSFRILAFDGSNATTFSYFGLVAMQGDRNVAGTDAAGKTFYALAVKTNEGFTTSLLQILKVDAVGFRGLQNISAPSTRVIASMVYPNTLSVGFTGTLEFQWITDITELNGVYLVARTGLLPNYTDLTDRLSVMDAVDPFSTTSGEGIMCCLENSVSSDVKRIGFDDTTLYELS